MARNVNQNVKYLERFEYSCQQCGNKGSVVDILLNPEVLLIRGFCAPCNKRGTYKAIDIEALRQEHEESALAETQEADPPQHQGRVVWRWELQNDECTKR